MNLRFPLRARVDIWQCAAVVIAGLVVVPIGVLLTSVFNPERSIWNHLYETILGTLMLNTFWLSMGVLICTSLLGVSLGWLTGACSFPGRRIFSWALILPLAMPAYVLAFIFIGVMDFTGPVQSLIRDLPGLQSTMVEVRSTPFVVLVLSLTLYPYVYLLSRTAFLSQGKGLMEAARTLGVGPWRGFLKVTLPMARPWIVSGLALVLMETLADFGAVSIFNYDTFTTAIYKAWFGFFSLQAAAQLSSILVVFALTLLLVEGQYRSKMRYHSLGKSNVVHGRIALEGRTALLATLFCTVVLAIAFILPVIQLIVWMVEAASDNILLAYTSQAVQTLVLGLGAALLTCCAALLLSYAKRRSPTRINTVLCKVSTMGYALPGTVLAVGIFIPGAWLDSQIQWLLATVFSMETGP